jgi:hypothetical protein
LAMDMEWARVIYGEGEDRRRGSQEVRSALAVDGERMRRCWAGIEAELLGEGGIAIVERATGMSRTTIRAGRDELRGGIDNAAVVEVRRPGGGRPRLEELNPGLVTGAAAPYRADARRAREIRDLRREGQLARRVRLRGLEGWLRDRQPTDVALEFVTNETGTSLPPVAGGELDVAFARPVMPSRA